MEYTLIKTTVMIALTKEQSENLRNLGLDPKSADMYYPYLGGGDYGDTPRIGSPMEYSGGEDIPTWSQDKLLKLLPKKIGLNPVKLQRGLLTDKWFCEYEGVKFFASEDSIDAVYQMMCWVLENEKAFTLNYE